MSRSQDTVIDDDEETCPLCIEEFDLSDKNFRPCPCGYQICQFCFNSLKTTYEKSTCPNCRRPYDESTIQYKIPTAEEFKLDLMNKNKKQAAAKRKETEKREVETSSRRNLAGVRVKQQNLVYVIGLEPTKKDESVLLETLRGKEFFGQYGDIEKIVVSKAKPGATNQGIGVYVTFKRKEDAATCIDAVDGSVNGERILRAQYGTTKYCSAFLRGEACMNKTCSFLHETGEDGHHTSLQNEPSETKHSSRPTLHTQTSGAIRVLSQGQSSYSSLPMGRQGSKDTNDSRKGSQDGSALPATAGWANPNAPISRARRASQVASRGTPSPQLSLATPLMQKSEPTKFAESSGSQSSKSGPKSIAKSSSSTSSKIEKSTPKQTEELFVSIFEQIKRSLTSENISFNYDDSFLNPEERAKIADMPPLYDLYGGAKRRIMEEKEVAERARIELEAKEKLEAQAKSTAEEALEEDTMATGSLALGGEPEDNPRGMSGRGAIQRPAQQLRAPGLPQLPTQSTAFEMSEFERRGNHFSQAQFDQMNNHQRNGSRYFNNDSKPPPASSSNRFQGGPQQQPFYSSAVQGPPPGLPTAGTPPVSGGGMFAHGQGFTNTGFGAAKESNADVLRGGRSGTSTGHDVSKRGGVEHLADPSILQARIHQGAGTTGQSLFGGNQVLQDSFPPLPPKETEVYVRIPALQSSQVGRPTTPKIPPGFENVTHSEADSSSTRQSNVTAPIVPVIPTGVAQHPQTPKTKSIVPETSANNQHDHASGNLHKLASSSTKAESDGAKSNKYSNRTDAPERLEQGPEISSEKPRAVERIITTSGQVVASDESATPSSKAASPLPDGLRGPRTIRLTTSMMRQTEQVASASPDIEKSKQEHSRQPSISSLSRSRPSTPAVSDQFFSRDVSRANSPPPGGIVGSAPARNKSKSQTKKDRKEKAKKVETIDEPGSVDTVPATPVEPVAPIIARQKKQKKKTSISAEPKSKTKTDIPGKSSPAINESPVKQTVDKIDEDIEASLRKSVHRPSYTMRDLCAEASQEGGEPGTIKKLLSEQIPSMTRLINDMISSGDLARDHPWLTNPSFSSAAYKLPSDSRKGQDYLDGNGYGSNDAFGYVYLPQKEKRALYAGHAVSVADTGDRKNDLLRRCLISPNGWVMRHLSTDESERVLELEERRSLYAEEFGELGHMSGLGVLEEDDFINLSGGIEELGRYGSRHGVCWVMSDENQDDEEIFDEIDDDDDEILAQDAMSEETDEDLDLDLTGTGNNGPWDPTFSTSASGRLSSNTLPPMQSGADMAVNLRSMDTDALHARIKEKHKEFDVSKKEAEKAEKALTRKSKEMSRWKDTILKA